MMGTLLHDVSSFFPVWNTTRAAGITAYLLLFLAMVSGMLQSLGKISPRMRQLLFATHNTAGWLGFLFGLVHGLVLLFDDYVGYTISDIFVPFVAKYKTLDTAAGIFALYSIFALVLTSDLLKVIGRKVWRSIHYFSFLGYILALYHGITLGPDSSQTGIQLMYIVTGVIVLALFSLRILFVFTGKKGKTGKAVAKP